jgi:hypothetical protein
MSIEGSAERGALADRLDRLIATVHPAGRGPYTLREIADAINAEAGTGYFSDEATAEEASQQLEVLAALRDVGVRSVALRAAGLSQSSLAAVHAVIENARRLEGLRDDDKDGP